MTGRTKGIRVRSLKAAGETIRTGRVPLCSWPAEGSRLTSQISPRFTTRVRCRQAWHRAMRDLRRKAGRHRHTAPGVPRGCIWDVSSAQRSGDRLPHRYPLWPHAEVQEIERCRGHSEHDGTADFAQVRGVHRRLQRYVFIQLKEVQSARVAQRRAGNEGVRQGTRYKTAQRPAARIARYSRDEAPGPGTAWSAVSRTA